MGGWIKLEKDRKDDPRVIRMARELRHAGVTHERFTPAMHVTLVLGCLDVLWCYADTHVRDDDTLDLGSDEIDELVGLAGFCKLMPSDWLEILDANRVKLPDFHAHNGTESKKKALNQKRQERKRNADALQELTQTSRSCVTDALPDQDQDQDQENTSVAGATAGSARKTKGISREFEQQVLALYHEVLPGLPKVRIWDAEDHKRLADRVSQTLGRGVEGADTADYWRKFFEKVARSDFLTGRSSSWRCPGLAWMVKPANFKKIVNGSYDNNTGDQHGRSYASASAAALG